MHNVDVESAIALRAALLIIANIMEKEGKDFEPSDVIVETLKLASSNLNTLQQRVVQLEKLLTEHGIFFIPAPQPPEE